MRTIVHLSDLHFGKVDPAIIDPLIELIHQTAPDLVAISGDLTQRARTSQFVEARRFVDRIPFPVLVVPGNHDIPWHNLWARFVRPLDRYREHICCDLNPFFLDDEVAVAGVNTARSLSTKYGRINERQLAEVAERFRPLGKKITKVLVTHHPFDLPIGDQNAHQLVGRAEVAMAVIATSEVDLLLSGHLHLTHADVTTERYQIAGYAALHVHAGTATSTRGRGEVNSLNVLRLEFESISVQRWLWSSTRRGFEAVDSEGFIRANGRWRRAHERQADGEAG
jgi:3',5'-cyclic AMP phosphodiesterase CpdA